LFDDRDQLIDQTALVENNEDLAADLLFEWAREEGYNVLGDWYVRLIEEEEEEDDDDDILVETEPEITNRGWV
jgi:hypothetical protein